MISKNAKLLHTVYWCTVSNSENINQRRAREDQPKEKENKEGNKILRLDGRHILPAFFVKPASWISL